MSRFSANGGRNQMPLAFGIALAAHATFFIVMVMAASKAKMPQPSAQALMLDAVELIADDAQSAPSEASVQPPPPETEPPPPEPEPPPPPPEPEPPPPPEPEPPPPEIIEPTISPETIAREKEQERKRIEKKREQQKIAQEQRERKEAQRREAKEAAKKSALAKQVSKAPTKRSTPQPSYPAKARRAGIEGTARVSFKIDSNGNVIAPRVTRSSGDADLDAAAVKGVSRWRFSPAINKLGQPIASSTSVNIVFKLK